jgi:hypothetical protein
VQAIEVLLIAAGVLIPVAWLTSKLLARYESDHPAYRLLLGIIPAAVGVMIVIIARYDVVPDELEGPLWLGLGLTIGVLAVLGTAYRFARR